MRLYILGETNNKLDGIVGFLPTHNLHFLDLYWILVNGVMELEFKTCIKIYAIIGKYIQKPQ